MSTRDTGRAAIYDMEDWWDDEQDAKKPVRQQRPRHRAQNLPPTVKLQDARGRAQRRKAQGTNRMLMYATFAVLVVCLFMQVNRYAQIALQTKKISALVSEVNALEADHANLELRLSARERIERVRDEAIYNLGMDYPVEGQVRVVALAQVGTDTEALTQTAAIPADLAQ